VPGYNSLQLAVLSVGTDWISINCD